MKGFYYLAILCIQFTALGQIGLPIQQSMLPKNSLVVNYDFSKPASFTRGNSFVTSIAASGNASVVNAPIFMNSLGFVSLDGVNQYVMTPNLRPFFKSVNASAQKSFTMSLWVYPTASNGVIVSEHDSQTLNTSFFTSNIELVNGIIKYKVWNGTEIVSSTIALNRWYHIAMVYSGTSVKAYLNGLLIGTQTYDRTIPPAGQFYGIGAQSSTTNMGSGVYGKFNLAQFKLYNLPLTDSEILQDYLARKDEFDYTIHSPSTNTNPTYWSVSSVWNSENTFGNLHYTPWLNNTSLGWAALYYDVNQSITLSYDAPTTIKGIVTQGRANNGGQWVTTAHIETSPNGAAPWTRILSNATLNTNSVDDVRILFPTPVFAKAVKILPVGWNNHITMRLGLLLKPIDITTSNLILYYNPAMTESYSGSGTTVNDISGNGMNGTLSNVTTSATAFTFNGSNSQVSIPDNAILEPGTGNWTIEVWFKPTVLNGTLIGKYNNGGNTANISYALRMGSNFIRADFSNGSTGFISDNYTLTPNNWVQMVYVWNKTNNVLYTYSNGVIKQTKTITISGILNSSTNLFLGSYNGGEYPQYFNGQIGVVRLYNKPLTAAEVLNNFNTTKGTYGL
jgi:hypothetical protein